MKARRSVGSTTFEVCGAPFATASFAKSECPGVVVTSLITGGAGFIAPGFEDMLRRMPSVDKSFSLTGFRSTTPFNAIIDQVISYIREQGQRAAAHAAASAQPVV